MAAKNPELIAFQTIIKALQPLEASVQDRVLASVFALLGKDLPDRQRSQSGDEGEEETASDRTSRPKGLTELLSEKTPGTNSQRIALFAYYRDKFENKSRFSRSDLREYFGRARLEPPGNYDRDFSGAVERGWIHENGDQSYITTSGIEIVEQGFQGERAYAKGGAKHASRKKGNKRRRRPKASKR
jgi:hypothetical protein